MKKQLFILMMALMLPTLNVFAQCDTRQNIIREYDAQIEYIQETQAESKRVIRNQNSQNSFIQPIRVAHYVTPVSYQDIEYSTQRVIGYNCVNDRANYQGNRALESLFRNGQTNQERLNKIDKTIIGAGPKTAKALLWYFTHSDTPKTWNEFEAIVNQAMANQKKKKATPQLISAMNKIITTHATENQNKLGLKNLNSNSCDQKVAVCGRIYGEDTIITRFSRELRDSFVVEVEVEFSGVSLLPNEKEEFHVSVDKDSLMPEIKTLSSVGQYQIIDIDQLGSLRSRVVLEGSRKLVAPRNSDYTVVLSLDSKNQAVITITDKKFLKGSGKKTIGIELVNTNWSNETEFSNQYTLSTDSAVTMINTGKKVKLSPTSMFRRSENYIVKSTIQVLESGYYNNNEVALRASNSIKSPTK